MRNTLMPEHPDSFPDYIIWRGWMIRAIDGDTIAVKLDLGFRVAVEIDIRLKDIDTPEMVGAERSAGIAAKEYVESIAPYGTPLQVMTQKMRRSFNRYVAEVSVWHEGQWKLLSQMIVDAGHGRWV